MRAPFVLITAIVGSLACRDATKTTRPYYAPAYALSAYTTSAFNPTSTDSIVCGIDATWPSAEPISVPWSGTVIVHAWRIKKGDRLFMSPTRTGSATLTIAGGPGDSVRVTLAGAVNISLDGRMLNASSFATGDWTCGAESTIGSHSPGEARGAWSLGRELTID